jgi:lipid-binding SYLF domain-containing protein
MIATPAEKQLTLCVDSRQPLKNIDDAGLVIELCCYISTKLFEDPPMKLHTSLIIAAFAGILGACQTSPTSQTENLTQEQVTEKRGKVLNMADKALARLYAQNPDVRKEIEQAAGYGVFDITAINAVLLVGARGSGVIVDNKTKKPTFMQSMRAGTGPGLGYQELYQIFIFKSREALDQFKVGDKVGGDLMASTTVGTTAVQISANPYITVYQLSEKGYALQANYGGAVYLVDPNLN